MSSVEELRSWYREARASRVVDALKCRGYSACYVPDAAAARKKILEIVPPGSLLATGGSMTLRQAGILDALLDRGDHFITDPSLPYGPELLEQRRKALNCDVYLTSTNALTEDGVLVNIDGTGNRVASMVFGPRTVVIIAGVNKITADLDEAMLRARHYAAVLNAKRLNCDTPCATKGECLDCRSPGRICRVLTIMERCPAETAVQVILVGEELGF
jgi:L-lactate utilization protein LutB